MISHVFEYKSEVNCTHIKQNCYEMKNLVQFIFMFNCFKIVCGVVNNLVFSCVTHVTAN